MADADDERARSLVARASVLVAAPRARVWEALLRPETIKQIMPVTDVVSGWSLGRPFLWKFEMQGESHEVSGVVLRLEPDHLLVYEYLDPHSADVLGIENRHRVTIELSDEDAGTRISVQQDNNLTRATFAHAEGGWRLALNNLRGVVERP